MKVKVNHSIVKFLQTFVIGMKMSKTHQNALQSTLAAAATQPRHKDCHFMKDSYHTSLPCAQQLHWQEPRHVWRRGGGGGFKSSSLGVPL